MKAIAIDPSEHNCGIVVVVNEGLRKKMTMSAERLLENLDTIGRSHHWTADLYVIEEPAMGAGSAMVHLATIRAWQDIVRVLKQKGMKIVQYRPADWKPVARARGWKSMRTMRILDDQHQKDAYSIYLYHRWREQRC